MTGSLLLSAQTEPIKVAWNGTTELLASKRVVVELEDGTRVEGAWLFVTERTFTMNIEKTSQKQIVPKGYQTLSKSSIRSLRVGKRNVRGRVLGTLGGSYGVVGLAAASTQSAEAMQGIWGFVMLAGSIAGYFLGQSSDKATREVVIVP